MSNYILRDGVPTVEDDAMTWARWFEKADRRVAFDAVGPMHVSTVFLGIDHNFGFRGKPVLWETIIFNAPDGSDHMDRYTSHEDAIAGHRRAVEEAKALLAPHLPTPSTPYDR